MSGQVYQYLGNDLHDLANVAKEYFAKTYGAKKFICETPLASGLELRPTWQAQMHGHYLLCVSAFTKKRTNLDEPPSDAAVARIG